LEINPMRTALLSRAFLVSQLALVLSLGACTVASPEVEDDDGTPVASASAALSSGPVSNRKPDGLILSTGNLYFTSHDATGATVWRASQASSPGQEGALFHETGATFGDIVYANVGGTWFGYFFAQNATGTTIKRVPLAGGAATVLATVTNIDIINSHHNLATDGVSLFWQDVSSVRKMPIGGGDITVLDEASPNTPTAGIWLRDGTVVYASVRDIRFVPIGGSTLPPSARTLATAAARVTTLRPVSNGVYWGDNNGTVQLKVGTTVSTIQTASGLIPTSIATNASASGGPLAWTDCASTCKLHFKFPGGNWFDPIAGDALGTVITGSGQVYWGDDNGVHRLVF
jgi:hypothetical protein